MNERVQEILDKATDLQEDYVIARLTYPDAAKAARSLGLHKTTVYKWHNFDQLEEAVTLLRRDAVEAARLALQALALDAVATLGGVQGGKSTAAINAANSILDRIGLLKQSAIKLSGGDEPIQVHFTWYDPNTDSDAQTAQSDSEADDHL